MPAFERRFATADLKTWCEQNPDSAVHALFDRWALPGQRAQGHRVLRIGIRNGYLNFYVMGQSVAKLSCGGAGPKIEVHGAYVAGIRKGDSAGDGVPGQRYERVAPQRADPVARWIDTAETYASAEKRFVDELIGANAGCIDLEMGLPADSEDGEGAAPRMDLVLARPGAGSTVAIEFWEAKCSNNSELRAKADYAEDEDGNWVCGPRVIHQVRKYERWMKSRERAREVVAAYQRTAKILLILFDMFPRSAGAEPACIDIWERCRHDGMHVVALPGIVIGNYCPDGHQLADETKGDPFKARAGSFRGKEPDHFGRLKKAGITVHEVGPGYLGPALPVLPDASVAT